MKKRFANWRLIVNQYIYDGHGSDKMFNSAGLLPAYLYVHL